MNKIYRNWSSTIINYKNIHKRIYTCITTLPMSCKIVEEKEFIIRSQEKNLNLNRDSNLGPPDFYPSALPFELSRFSCQLMLKSPSWDRCHFYQAVRSWHYLPFYCILFSLSRKLFSYGQTLKGIRWGQRKLRIFHKETS